MHLCRKRSALDHSNTIRGCKFLFVFIRGSGLDVTYSLNRVVKKRAQVISERQNREWHSPALITKRNYYRVWPGPSNYEELSTSHV